MSHKLKISTLNKKIKFLKNFILDICYKKGGHLASSLSCLEILVFLYYSGYLKISPKFLNSKRDIFVISKGHASEAVYAILGDLNFFPKKWFTNSFRDNDCKLGGHVSFKVPGVELSTGSLGHGLGYIAGVALANKLDRVKKKHVVLLGDAEITAGSIWEAAAFISYEKLNNVIAIIDYNKIGNFQRVSKFLNEDSLSKKWQSFGWRVIHIKYGNKLENIIKVFKKIKFSKKPIVVICHTVKGSGISFMENDPIWATRQLDESNYKKAKLEINK